MNKIIKYLLALGMLILLAVIVTPTIPCSPYLNDEGMVILLSKAKQGDRDALRSLKSFFSYRGENVNFELCRCADCQNRKRDNNDTSEGYCDRLLENHHCPDSPLEKIVINRGARPDDAWWCTKRRNLSYDLSPLIQAEDTKNSQLK